MFHPSYPVRVAAGRLSRFQIPSGCDERGREVPLVEMRECRALTQDVADLSAKRHLDAFDGVENMQTEGTVESRSGVTGSATAARPRHRA